jgi:hypothetical protein
MALNTVNASTRACVLPLLVAWQGGVCCTLLVASVSAYFVFPVCVQPDGLMSIVDSVLASR